MEMLKGLIFLFPFPQDNTNSCSNENLLSPFRVCVHCSLYSKDFHAIRKCEYRQVCHCLSQHRWSSCLHKPNGPAAWPVPLPYGSHDLVCPLALVQPGVLAVAHQVTHLHFLASHVLVEITDIQLFEFFQAQHTYGKRGKAS